jgi:threonine dehydrogenase-like Zn-dependent dehydrogenase
VKRHLPHLIEHVRAGRLKPRELITHRVPLEEVDEAYHRFSAKQDGCIKTLLIPPRAGALDVPSSRPASAPLH